MRQASQIGAAGCAGTLAAPGFAFREGEADPDPDPATQETR
jgi:hypothetical protein